MLTRIKPIPVSLFALTVLATALQLYMVMCFEVNWDEFFYLGWVYQWIDGDLNLVLQTIFFRFFTWLPDVSGNEVTQIVAARAIMFLGLLASCLMLFAIIRRFFTQQAALLSVLLFLSHTYVFRHATSFRADMIVTTLGIMVLWLIMKKHLLWRDVIVGGIIFGLAGMVSIKSVFYAPTIAVILLSHWGQSQWSRTVFFKSLTMGLISAAAFASFYGIHAASIQNANSGTDYISNVAGASLLQGGFFPRVKDFAINIFQNILFWATFYIGFRSIIKTGWKKETLWRSVAFMGFALPLLTLLFYRHAHPYYYPFMLAPLTLLIAAFFDLPFIRLHPKRILFLCVIIAVNFGIVTVRSIPQNLKEQERVIAAVHAIFPTKTTYIDRNDMVSSFPKVGLFMSRWYMGNYYTNNTPIFGEILKTAQPKFILANLDSLDLDTLPPMPVPHNNEAKSQRRFLSGDEDLLKNNYIHHWGPIYVAGKTIYLEANKVFQTPMIIEGNYTVESRHPVQINGVKYNNGDIISLPAGNLTILTAQPQELSLRWGEALFMPQTTPPTGKLFNGF